jgi:membrane protease YdiL (CAAX protease family)
MGDHDKLKALGLWPSLLIFGSAGLVLFLETHYLIPWLKTKTGIEPVIFWFLLAGLAMFLPLLIIAYFMLRAEKVLQQPDLWHRRLRFRKMDRYAWWWTAGSVLLIGLLSTVVMNILEVITGPYDQQPPFMRLEPLSPGRYWILLVWLPYWLLNIMGEEILWRGVIFPRQEIVFGAYTWLFHGFCWSLFHLAFGWQLLLMMLPILFIQSLAVQKTKNTWVGVLIHAVINGPSFIAIALGVL